MSRTKFETLTLGTLGVILLIGLAGYWLGRPVRARMALALESPAP